MQHPVPKLPFNVKPLQLTQAPIPNVLLFDCYNFQIVSKPHVYATGFNVWGQFGHEDVPSDFISMAD